MIGANDSNGLHSHSGCRSLCAGAGSKFSKVWCMVTSYRKYTWTLTFENLFQFCLPRRLVQCNLFLFLDAALYIQIGGALDYWYTAGDSCVAAGIIGTRSYVNNHFLSKQ